MPPRIDPSRARVATKLLCPDSLVTTLLGSRGMLKDQLQEETGTKLVFSNKNDYYPGTNLRVLAIFSDDTQCLFNAVEKILQRVHEHGDSDRSSLGANAFRDGGSDFLGKEDGELCFRLCITKETSGEIIGTGGSNIKQLRRDSGAKVFIENDTQLGHQMVRIIGLPNAILSCLDLMMVTLLKGAGTEEFNAWAQFVNFSEGGWGAGGAGAGALAPQPEVILPKFAGKGGARAFGVPPDSGANDREGQRIKLPAHVAQAQATSPPVSSDDRHQQLTDIVASFPPGTAGMAYSITIDLPKILQELNEDLSFVEVGAGVQINVEAAEEAAEGAEALPSKVSVVGPLRGCYAAHLMIVQRAQEREHEKEQAALAEEEANIMEPEDDTDDPEVLRGNIRKLRFQVRDLRQLLRNHGIDDGVSNDSAVDGEQAPTGDAGKGKLEFKGGVDLRNVNLKGGKKRR